MSGFSSLIKAKKVYDGSLTILKERFSTIKTILFSTEKPIEQDLQLERLEFVRKDDFHFEIHYQSKFWTSAQVIEQVFNHFTVEDVTMKELEIETMVRQIYEEGIIRKYFYIDPPDYDDCHAIQGFLSSNLRFTGSEDLGGSLCLENYFLYSI